jgi:hypothetical protein
MAPRTIHGRRRPKRERVRSETRPIIRIGDGVDDLRDQQNRTGRVRTDSGDLEQKRIEEKAPNNLRNGGPSVWTEK